MHSCLRVAILALLFGGSLTPVAAQDHSHVTSDDIGMVYRIARFQKEFREIIENMERSVVPLPLELLPSASDTLSQWIRQRALGSAAVEEGGEEDGKDTLDWRVIKRDERLAWKGRFENMEWAFLGNDYFTSLDTTQTMAIRARMESRFGPPTKTIVDVDYVQKERGHYIQFEYWFVLSDSILLMVTDVNGPADRGVIVAVDHRYRNVLFDLRQSFIGDIIREESPAPYVDYYYNYVQRRWYRVGYDGKKMFIRRIREPDLARGRPKLIP